jgi:coenzyme F420-0:L-glutamate ligase/coenzyme F420-1:gamma-L-glutamate ligase
MKNGWILTANAGLDQSNVPKGHAIGWPSDAVKSIRKLREVFHTTDSGQRIGIIVSDSCCRPMRLGVTAIALLASGIDPIRSLKGTDDLFGRRLRITNEAIADQLATAANAVMGNAAESIPAAIIRDHGIPSSDFEGWVPGIEIEEDIYKEVL